MIECVLNIIILIFIGNCSNSITEKRKANGNNFDNVFYSSLSLHRNHVTKTEINLDIFIFIMLLLIWHHFYQVSEKSKNVSIVTILYYETIHIVVDY